MSHQQLRSYGWRQGLDRKPHPKYERNLGWNPPLWVLQRQKESDLTTRKTCMNKFKGVRFVSYEQVLNFLECVGCLGAGVECHLNHKLKLYYVGTSTCMAKMEVDTVIP